MKTLKFKSNLADMILKGEKTSTWRLFDDKDLSVGDEVSFIVQETGETFAKALFTNVSEVEFSKMKKEDLEGHEKYQSTEEMLTSFAGYYNKRVTMNTKVKVIKFELIK